MFHDDLAIILTARMSSERLPGKVILPVAGKPLLQWIIERLQPLGNVIVATTDDVSDAPIMEIARRLDVPLYLGSLNDVVGRMDGAVKRYLPKAEWVIRALGDCPFFATELQSYMVDTLAKYQQDIFVYALAPYAATTVVYGSRESPYSRESWNLVVQESITREHVDQFYHEHRNLFHTLYHEAPSNIYLRGHYRLEVDWLSDIELIKKIAENVGMLAPVPEIIRYLDNNSDVARINRENVEKTGLSCYDYSTQRKWMKAMEGQIIYCWDGTRWNPPSEKAQPIFCRGGIDLLGYESDGILHTKIGRISSGYMSCTCGSGLFWHVKK